LRIEVAGSPRLLPDVAGQDGSHSGHVCETLRDGVADELGLRIRARFGYNIKAANLLPAIVKAATGTPTRSPPLFDPHVGQTAAAGDVLNGQIGGL